MDENKNENKDVETQEDKNVENSEDKDTSIVEDKSGEETPEKNNARIEEKENTIEETPEENIEEVKEDNKDINDIVLKLQRDNAELRVDLLLKDNDLQELKDILNIDDFIDLDKEESLNKISKYSSVIDSIYNRRVSKEEEVKNEKILSGVDYDLGKGKIENNGLMKAKDFYNLSLSEKAKMYETNPEEVEQILKNK